MKEKSSKRVSAKSRAISWGLFWCAFLTILILIDTYFFRPLDISHAVINQPAEGLREDETLAISWLGPPNFAVGKEDLWIEDMLEERFNVELTPILLDPNAYQRKKPLMLAGGPVPDLVWEADPISLQKAVLHRFIAELPYEMIYKYMPEYYKDLTKEAPEAWLYSTVDGRNFGIPTLNRYGSQPSRSGVWRYDWLRNVGIDKVPETLEEFEEALRRIRYEDPDRNGLQDTYGMSGDISNWWWSSFSEIFGAFGVTPFDWQVEDGAIVWGGIKPETKEALKLLNKWYEAGLIHPDFATDSAASGQSIEQKFYAGKIGYLNYKGTYEDLRRSISGSFGNNFLNLRLAEILSQQEIMASSFLDSLANSLLEALADDHIRQILKAEYLAPQIGDVNKVVLHWLRKELIFNRFDNYESRQLPDHNELTQQQDRLESDKGLKLTLEEVRDYLGMRLNVAFQPEEVIAFKKDCHDFLEGWQPSEAALHLLEGGFDGDLRHLIAQGFGETDVSFRGGDQSIPAIVRTYFFRKLDEGEVPPILVPGRAPVGPEGKSGVRAWGKPGNILAFGRQVADAPEKAIRIMKMLEAMHTDIDLYWQSRMGEEGTHWEWWDPIHKQESGEGFTLKPDFHDPQSGDIVDLQVTKNAKRYMLHPSLGFYNLVAGKKEFASYEEQNKFEFDKVHLREEWGLVNPLGKSDVVPSAARFLGDLRMRQQTFFAEIIRGSRPISDFDEFVVTWQEKGGAVLLEEANLMYTDWKNILAQVKEPWMIDQ